MNDEGRLEQVIELFGDVDVEARIRVRQHKIVNRIGLGEAILLQPRLARSAEFSPPLLTCAGLSLPTQLSSSTLLLLGKVIE